MLFLKTLGTQFAGFWAKITATDLGAGSTGAGNKYLADDMTWKPIATSSSGGPGGVLDGGEMLTGVAYFDGGSVV